jgi:hypothetical protein
MQFSLVLSFVAIRTFQTSGEALSKAKSMSLLSPIDAILNTPIIGNAGLAMGFSLIFGAGSLVSIFVLRGRTAKAAAILFISLILLYLSGAITGGYPTGRSWIPYWFPISVISGDIFYLRLFNKNTIYSSISVFLACLAYGFSSILTYTPHYTHYWRSNDYQVKALMFHSANGKIQCLEDRDQGDKVLMFYWDDPKSAIVRPPGCKESEKSPLGFSNFDVPAKPYELPRKIYGKYDSSTHTGWYIDTIMAPKNEHSEQF